jgi:S-adenosylmethionine synthetase
MVCSKILVTGASGLLGTAVTACLAPAATVIGVAHRHAGPGLRALDFTVPAAFDRLAAEDWNAVVHCAAFRSPDFCEEDREAARRLNAEAPARIAELAAARRARMIHISTDYVFDGTHPPYRETDPCAPVNYYGLTKWEAEQAVTRIYPAAVILRIGALYGAPPAPAASPMLDEALVAVCTTADVELDDRIVRCPSYTDDIAAVIRFLLALDCAGVLHASAAQSVTRHAWTRLIAGLLGRDTGHLHPAERDLARPARRPVNPRLAVDRLKVLGGPIPRDCGDVLPLLLARRVEKGLCDRTHSG